MAEALELAVVAGEASGDAHAAALVRAFAPLAPETRWFGAGGPALRKAGVETLVDSEALAVVGIGEVLAHLPALWRAMGTLKRALRERRPAALVLVDYPDFNFRLAKFARAVGIPVVYYIPPQVWAWRKGRTRFLSRNVDRALVLFPFEEEFLRSRGVDVRFVGHPLVDTARTATPLPEFLTRHGLEPGTPRVALLPGSRRSEVVRNLPVLCEAAVRLTERCPGAAVFIPWAPGLPDELRQPFVRVPVRWTEGEYADVLGHADAAAVASGTATLEAALLGVPQVIVYRVKPLTYWIGRRLVKLPHVGLPNVVAGREAVPELLQDDFTGESVARALGAILDSGEEAKSRARDLASEIRKRLGEGGSSARAASELHAFLEGVRPL